jgi:large subunit ribosomal protein L25
VKVGGGIVSHVMNEVEISCLPADLPEFIEVDLKDLALGHSVHLSELKFPKGAEATALVKGNDAVVATVQVPKAIVIEEPVVVPTAEEAAAAEGVAAEAGAVPGEKKEGEKAADKPDAGRKEGGKPEGGKKEGGKGEKAEKK